MVVITTNEAYSSSFVTQIGTFGSVALLMLTSTLHKGNEERNQKIWNSVSTQRDILHVQVLLECCYTYK
jgi:hypothetical protein